MSPDRDPVGDGRRDREPDGADGGANTVVTRVVAHVVAFADRAVRVLGIAVAGAALLGAVAFVLGWFAAVDPWPGYALVALPLTAAPAVVAALARGRVRSVVEGGPRLVSDLRDAATDPQVRRRLAALASRSSTRGWRRARELWRLRTDVLGPHTRTLELWVSVLALARLPWILLVTAIGSALLIVWSLVALVMLVWP